MRYKVIIEEYNENVPKESSGPYREYWVEVYKQQIENLSVEAVVRFLNSILSKRLMDEVKE